MALMNGRNSTSSRGDKAPSLLRVLLLLQSGRLSNRLAARDSKRPGDRPPHPGCDLMAPASRMVKLVSPECVTVVEHERCDTFIYVYNYGRRYTLGTEQEKLYAFICAEHLSSLS